MYEYTQLGHLRYNEIIDKTTKIDQNYCPCLSLELNAQLFEAVAEVQASILCDEVQGGFPRKGSSEGQEISQSMGSGFD